MNSIKRLLFVMMVILALTGSVMLFSACNNDAPVPKLCTVCGEKLSAVGRCATCENKGFAVIFKSGGGSEVEAIESVKNGRRIPKPSDPSKKDYSFGGWYKDTGLKDPWIFAEDIVLADTTLYARWNFHFNYDDTASGYIITGFTEHGKEIKNLEIPAVIGGKSVVGLGEYAFFNCLNLESVLLPDSIENVSVGAFNGCKNLAAVTFPTNLIEIERFAFSFCEKLSTIVLPDTLQSIEYGAFEHCTELETISVSEKSSLTTVEGGNFDNTKWFAALPDNDFVYLNNLLYKYKGKLASGTVVDIKEGTVAIAQGAFYEQSGLVEINFPDSLTAINERAFTRTGVRSINLTKNITDFSAACFEQNDILSITLADANKSFCIKDGVLYDILHDTLVLYPNLATRTSFTVPDGVKAIGQYAFANNKYLTSVNFPETLEVIDRGAFISTRRIKFLDVPKALLQLGDQAFDYSGITYVSMRGDAPRWDMRNNNIVFFVGNDKVEQYKSAWNNGSYNCKIFSENSLVGSFLVDGDVLIKYFGSESLVTVPEGVKVIGEYAFYQNVEISNVVLPEGVEEIKPYAFSSSGLSAIDLPDSLKIIGDGAFNFCQGITGDFKISAGVEQISAGAFLACFNLNNFVVDTANKQYYSTDGVLFDRDLKMLVCYPNRNGYNMSGEPFVKDTYTTPDGIEVIGEYAFSYTFIKNIILPNSLKVIRDSAFFECEYVENLVIPEGVTDIGGTAFTYCNELESIIIPASVTNWGISPFRDFRADQTIKFRGSQSSIPTQVLSCDAKFVFEYTE